MVCYRPAPPIGCILCGGMSATKSTPAPILFYRFGPYEADISRNQLRKFGLRVRLERKPWQLLIALLQRPGELVTRLELQHALWGDDVFVDFEHGLNVAVKKLRGALNDSAEAPVYVETVAGQGHRFIAEVERVFPDAAASPSAELLRDPLTQKDSLQLLAVRRPEERVASIPAGGARQFWLQKRKVWSAAAVVVCAALLAVAAAKLDWRRLRQPVRPNSGRTMLVVLPFENLSGDPGQEYLSDGITEELSAQLGNFGVQHMGVIGRTSAMTYKHSRTTIGQIGDDLAVDYVVEGSVRRDGNKLRVTAQLVQVLNETRVWAQSYDREMIDLLELEREVAAEIARHVGVSITIDQATKPNLPHIPNTAAHESYLQGRYNWYKRTEAGWKTGEEYFRRAIREDPYYAAAYAGLAECRIPRSDALTAALKAISLDPNSGEAHTALGWVQMYRYLDLAAAGLAFARAIELSPNYSYAHYSYGVYLGFIGHTHDSITEIKQAVLLDPLSPLLKSGLALSLAQTGQVDDAMKQLRSIFETNPDFAVARESLGVILTQQGRYEEAIAEFRTKGRLGGDPNLSAIAYAYALWGKKEEALRTLSQLQKSESGPADLALVEIGLGHKEKAVAWLEKAYEDHDDDTLLNIKTDPVFDPLRSHPRFQDLVRRMNFPP
jgi:TolB-like protein/DNA-binding winged helix-turn-helix (wHTH) protein/lipoprotein NlpI